MIAIFPIESEEFPMVKRLASVFLLCALLLSGCSESNEVENLAYVLILGLDLTDDGQIRVCAQIPKITGKDDASGGSGDGSELVFSAEGGSFPEALSRLEWIVPRRLDLSQLQLVIVSEKMARSERFAAAATLMIDAYRLYTATRLAVCAGEAKSFVEQETMLIGSRIATELTAMFENYTDSGYIPDVQFADVYYKTQSVYSDPVAIYAAQGEADEGAKKDAETWFSINRTAAVSPDAAQNGALPTEAAGSPSSGEQSLSLSSIQPALPRDADTASAASPQTNRFLGAAVFVDGRMVGRLDGPQTLFCNLLSGKKQAFYMTVNGQSLSLSTMGRPSVSVDVSAELLRIDVKLRVALLPDSEVTDAKAAREALNRELMETVSACKRMGAEPFQFAEIAARSFPTLERWQAYGWRAHWLASEVTVDAEITHREL